MKVIKELELEVKKVKIDFHNYFWNRSINLQKLAKEGIYNQDEATSIPNDCEIPESFIYFLNINFTQIKIHFIDVLLSKSSAKILWSLYCTPINKINSTLSKISPLFETIAHTVRGGVNIYKLNGWLVHVLIGYSIIADYIPNQKLPNSIKWSPYIKKFFRNFLKDIYKSFDEINKLILNVGFLSHDIGVSIDITDHNIHGVPLVTSFLKDLNIDKISLKNRYPALDFEDFIWAIQTIVKFHPFVNRIGIEFSIERSATEVESLKKSASKNWWRKSFIENTFTSILLLVAVGDLIAVNDSLLSNRKIDEMNKGYNILRSLLIGESDFKDDLKEGFIRFKCFLSDQNLYNNRNELEREIIEYGYNPNEFWSKFFNIQEFNFVLPLVPYLPKASDTLLMFLLIFYFIDVTLGSSIDIYKNTRVVFDHLIDPKYLISQLKKITTVSPIQYKVSIENGIGRIGDIKLHLLKDSFGNLILVKRQN